MNPADEIKQLIGLLDQLQPDTRIKALSDIIEKYLHTLTDEGRAFVKTAYMEGKKQ